MISATFWPSLEMEGALDRSRYSAISAFVTLALVAACVPPGSYGPVLDAERDRFRQSVVPFVGRDMEFRSPIPILDQPQANSAQHLASGRFKIDSVGGISEIGQVWAHAVFVSGASGYFLTDAALLSNSLYAPPPPPKPLIYPSFIDKLPAKEAAKRHQLPGVQIGMTEDQVPASAWGVPIRKKIVRSSRGLREEWHYPHGNVLIFEDGRLEGYET